MAGIWVARPMPDRGSRPARSRLLAESLTSPQARIVAPIPDRLTVYALTLVAFLLPRLAVATYPLVNVLCLWPSRLNAAGGGGVDSFGTSAQQWHEAGCSGGSMKRRNRKGVRQLSHQLFEASRMFARSAMSSYANEKWEFFYLHLATALEQLIKAVLVAADPVLIAEERPGFETLLHLAGYGHRAGDTDFWAGVRTVSVSQSFDRVARLVEPYKQHGPGVRRLLDIRNSLVHAGLGGKIAAEQVLGDTAEYMEQLLVSLNTDSADYWGDSAELVEEHRGRRLDAITAAYRRRVQAAKNHYATVIEGMDDSARTAFLAAVFPSSEGLPTDLLRDCPACANEGVLHLGYAEPDWEPDYDYGDGQTYIAGLYVSKIRCFGHEFTCRACGLDLMDNDLQLAGMDDFTLTERNFDVGTATQAFQGRLIEEEFGPEPPGGWPQLPPVKS